MTKVSVVIVDDEPLARRRLRELIAERPEIRVIGEATTGREAVERIDALRPDVVFLDIELPEMSGLDVVRQMGHQPLVVFTTAFDRYAVTAFELAAIDYLLKPFGPERLATAIDRVTRALEEGNEGAPLSERAEEALQASRDTPLRRFFVRDRGKLVPISAREVERLEADDDYVRVHVRGRVHLVYLTLNDFERRLDSERFLRIHRGHIVNLDFVRHLVPGDGGRIEIEMHDGTRVQASRTRSRELRELAL
ncbi:MAG: LytR/AlgR family response regulator transcription factor [Gemmatimonadaceae bacterium]